MKKTIILVSALLSLGTFAQQQEERVNNPAEFQVNITPPSPEAYKLGSFGNVPVGMFTGTPNIDIPLIEYGPKTNNTSIGLNYSSSGIRVDEQSGFAGLGWKMVAGGVITRVVRGIPDEKSNPNIGFTNPPDLDSIGVEDNNVRTYLQAVSSGYVDSEPDVYYASFGNKSLSFVFDKRGFPVLVSQQNVQIEKDSANSQFIITVEDGTKYYFAEKEITTNSQTGGGHNIPKTNISAWYLSKIVDTRNQEIYFEYEDRTYTTVLSRSQTLTMTPIGANYARMDEHGNCVNGYSMPPTISSAMTNLQNVKGKRLKRIYSNNVFFGEVQISYNQLVIDESGQISTIKKLLNNNVIESYTFNYTKTATERIFLNDITETNSGRKYSFEYIDPEQVPARLSYSRDMYGYYNGKNNSTLVPKVDDLLVKDVVYDGADQSIVEVNAKKGLLKKIIYPTNGYTLLEYESNTYGGTRIITPSKTAAQLYVHRKIGSSNPDDKITDETIVDNKRSQYMLAVMFSGYNDECEGVSDEVPGHHTSAFWAVDQNNQPVPQNTVGNCPGFIGPTPVNGMSSACYVVPKGMQVKFKLQANFRCTIGSLNVNYIPDEDQEIPDNIPVGGLRVKEIASYNIDGTQPIIKKYNYNTGNAGMSSGIQVRKPYYLDRSTSGIFCKMDNSAFDEFPYINISSDNLNPLYPSHPAFFYKSVIESIGTDGGYTLHEFSTGQDNYGKIMQGVDIKSAPWTNFGWNNGKELAVLYFDKNNSLGKKIENHYEQDESRKYSVRGLRIRTDYDLLTYIPDPTRVCTADNINFKYTETDCTAGHFHTFYNNKCIAEGAVNVERTVYDECYGKPIGTSFPHSGIVNNLSIVQYENFSYFTFLESRKTTDYLNGTPVKTETQYFYNNPKHTQLTSQKTIFPDLSNLFTNYAYAYEKNNPLLISKNMVGIPLETAVTKTEGNSTKMLSKSETIYPTTLPTSQTGNLVLPTSVVSYDLQNPTVTSNEVNYEKYDSKGNIVQYTTKDGVSTVIIWGYENTLPIAKIVGAKLSDINQSLIDSIVIASQTDGSQGTIASEERMLNTLDGFKNNSALSGYQVTTYTYDPLIGVRSITPPSGIREVYLYDDAGRLKEIREQNNTGKLLKEFNYHYKN
ncbi:hypothetical protein [Chryseobacterium bernardetii]|uniref:hypothetical protein n=1 Tax=Chryseobacterium bernardetii TaxID=1241978 RepID=UPI003AF9E018